MKNFVAVALKMCIGLGWVIAPVGWWLVTGPAQVAQAEEADAALQKRLETKFKEIEGWAANAKLVAAVKAFNATPPAEYKDMDQKKWKELTVLDPLVRAFNKNETAGLLKEEQGKDPAMAEAFVSAANGTKVAFLAKPTNWSHLGKPKHDNPMKGMKWTGPVEVDESSGVKQIQIAVPVLDGGKPIGSLVVGFSIVKLK